MKITFCGLMILLGQYIHAQDVEIKYQLKLSSVDTVDEKRKYFEVTIDWLDSLIDVRQWKPFALDSIDFLASKKIAKSAKLEYQAPDSSWAKYYNRSTQNCYTNSQEHILLYNGIDPSRIFNKTTTIGMYNFKKILGAIYSMKASVSVKPKKNLKQKFPNNTLIVFRNKSNWPTHAMFHNKGFFYSKYGSLSFKKETSLKDVYEHYWDTMFVEVYELDWEKLLPYLEKI